LQLVSYFDLHDNSGSKADTEGRRRNGQMACARDRQTIDKDAGIIGFGANLSISRLLAGNQRRD
jgi:hypothetical protein